MHDEIFCWNLLLIPLLCLSISSLLTQMNLIPDMCFWHHSYRLLVVNRNPLVVAWRPACATSVFTVPPLPSHTHFPCDVAKNAIRLLFQSLHSALLSYWSFWIFCTALLRHHWNKHCLNSVGMVQRAIRDARRWRGTGTSDCLLIRIRGRDSTFVDAAVHRTPAAVLVPLTCWVQIYDSPTVPFSWQA